MLVTISESAGHIRQRVSALAQSGEIMVLGTVKYLVAGSGIELEDGTEHDLQGHVGSMEIVRFQDVTGRSGYADIERAAKGAPYRWTAGRFVAMPDPASVFCTVTGASLHLVKGQG